MHCKMIYDIECFDFSPTWLQQTVLLNRTKKTSIYDTDYLKHNIVLNDIL